MNIEYGKLAEKIGAFAAPGSKVHIESQTIIVSGQDARSERQGGGRYMSAGMLNTVIAGNYLFHNNEKAKKERQQIFVSRDTHPCRAHSRHDRVSARGNDVPLALVSGQKIDKGEGDISLEQGTKRDEMVQKQRLEKEPLLSKIIAQGQDKIKEKGIALIEKMAAGQTTGQYYQSESTGREAAESLGKICTVSKIGTLVQLLQDTRNEETRWQVAKDLGEIGNGDSEAIEALVQVLENSRNGETRRQVVESLGKIGNGSPKAIRALVQVFQLDRDRRTHWPATASLGKVCTVYYHLEKWMLEMLER
ncbi:MAG: HEAT repeat domain-containing protein [Hormoscilla sp. GM7CHS1pb]|nr:HEAT repeat domain-containing protein [Hormoscilla sp. GM7CHS1pb]